MGRFNTLVKSEEQVAFKAKADGQDPEPCLDKSLMQAAKLRSGISIKTQCRPLSEWAEHASWQFDQASLRLQLAIPMTAVPAATWLYSRE